MIRLSKSIPKYRKHRASGQAVTTLNGKDHYLGPHNTNVSRAEYDRLISEWLVNGRQVKPESHDQLSVVEVIASYADHATSYYCGPDGNPTSEVEDLALSLRQLKKLYGRKAVTSFGPVALKAVRQNMIENGLARKLINQRINRIKRMFKWAAGAELIPASIPQALSMVEGLKRGRSKAKETERIKPVSVEVVEATLPFLGDIVADMVRVQRLISCRPGEICKMRPCDIDRSCEVWLYHPADHKTAYLEKVRTIFIGPKAQSILLRYLARDSQMYCFRPCDADAKRRAALHLNRKTPNSCGNTLGSNKQRKPKKTPGEYYSTKAYHQAIQNACKKAFPAPEEIENNPEDRKAWRKECFWGPNRLRHSAATEIRKVYGLEGAQIALGHSKANVTELYAERDLERGIQIAKERG